jgi:tripartite-type tricarboxylate transporter receptor subunit TctC
VPDIRTLGEFQPGFEASAWVAIGAPKNMPVNIIDKLNMEINAGLADPKIAARTAELGATVFVSSPADLDNSSSSKPRNGPRFRAANIKVE